MKENKTIVDNINNFSKGIDNNQSKVSKAELNLESYFDKINFIVNKAIEDIESLNKDVRLDLKVSLKDVAYFNMRSEHCIKQVSNGIIKLKKDKHKNETD